MNSTFVNSEKIDHQQGEATIIIHPDDAKNLELMDAEPVRVFNETGSLELQLQVSLETQQGVALSYKDRWLKRERSMSNVNVLNSGEKQIWAKAAPSTVSKFRSKESHLNISLIIRPNSLVKIV